jgi:hypothetical protein
MPFDLPKLGKDGLSASQAPYAVQLHTGKVVLCSTLADTDALPRAKFEKRHQNYEKRQRKRQQH